MPSASQAAEILTEPFTHRHKLFGTSLDVWMIRLPVGEHLQVKILKRLEDVSQIKTKIPLTTTGFAVLMPVRISAFKYTSPFLDFSQQ